MFFGPEILGRLKEDFGVHFFSMDGGIIKSSQNVPILTKSLLKFEEKNYTLIIPGGIGLRELVKNEIFLNHLKLISNNAEYILTICTGSILLSKTGLLNNKRATTNKRIFTWTREFPDVFWVKKGRWINDGNIYTSSGVSGDRYDIRIYC